MVRGATYKGTSGVTAAEGIARLRSQVAEARAVIRVRFVDH